MCVSLGKKFSFFGKLGVLCFLVTRFEICPFALLPTNQHTIYINIHPFFQQIYFYKHCRIHNFISIHLHLITMIIVRYLNFRMLNNLQTIRKLILSKYGIIESGSTYTNTFPIKNSFKKQKFSGQEFFKKK